MKIGLLYAMPAEAESLLQRFGTPTKEKIFGVPFYRLDAQTVACVGGVGKVNAAQAAQILAEHYGVERIINAGCAGALEPLPAGTLVVGAACVQYDVDTTLAGDPPGFVSTVERVEFPCDRPKETAALLSAQGFQTVQGTVATGDWFGRDTQRAQWIRETFHALVCDMEAAAAAQVCLRAQLPFFTIKAVSDHLFGADQAAEYRAHHRAVMPALNDTVAAYLKLCRGGKIEK